MKWAQGVFKLGWKFKTTKSHWQFPSQTSDSNLATTPQLHPPPPATSLHFYLSSRHSWSPVIVIYPSSLQLPCEELPLFPIDGRESAQFAALDSAASLPVTRTTVITGVWSAVKPAAATTSHCLLITSHHICFLLHSSPDWLHSDDITGGKESLTSHWEDHFCLIDLIHPKLHHRQLNDCICEQTYFRKTNLWYMML